MSTSPQNFHLFVVVCEWMHFQKDCLVQSKSFPNFKEMGRVKFGGASKLHEL